ncbi:MAG: HK97 gp10 family phage protein [Coprobacillus sp.]|nr:HK97 gp10 family phage protein [Coprobacillus sp.]
MAKWGKCDIRQLKRLQKKMEKFSKVENEEFCEMCAKYLAARLLSRVIKATPVETGTLRRSWSEENSNVYVEHKGNEFTCEIINSTSYAIYVEYGHRLKGNRGWVHGYFMLEKSTLQLDAQAPRIVEKLLMQKLGEIFNDQ